MEKRYMSIKRLTGAMALVAMSVSTLTLTGCKETIDSSNFAIADEPTVFDYLSDDDRFSDMVSVFERVNLVEVPEGSNYTSSSIANTLQTRGNYTCFIPTNEAVEEYVSRVTGGATTDVSQLTEEQATNLAKNCIIDNGDNMAYESPDFPTDGSFAISNMNDRVLTCEEVSVDESGAPLTESYYLINGEARVTETDHEVSNGIIHVVDRVIAPSSDNVADMIKAADNMHLFSYLLTLTGWDVKMTNYRDEDYEAQEKDELMNLANVGDVTVQQRRNFGYTAFVETDDVYEAEWGLNIQYNEATGAIENWAEIEPQIIQKVTAVYGEQDADDYTSENNALNRFVAYHLLEGGIRPGGFVHHLNEYNYRYGSDIQNPSTNYTVDVWDYYTTIGSRRGLMKIVQSAFESDYPYYINRVCEYDNDRYQQQSVVNRGVKLSLTNGNNDNNALNGFYYPIDAVLLYDNQVRTDLANERIRVDLTTMLPELASNNIRAGAYRAFPTGYFSNITNESSSTKIFYLNVAYNPRGTHNWKDAQGDEFIFSGVYDFVLKLPPVPADGLYEIRMGLSNNNLRGMAQIYFGDDPNNLLPAGLPVDMRQEFKNGQNPGIPWVADSKTDEVINRENDKNLRNQGYMKGPKYYMMCDGLGPDSKTIREAADVDQPALRRIITTENLRADRTYYLRFKSALDSRDAQFFVDYFELVNSSVYNGAEAEDVW